MMECLDEKLRRKKGVYDEKYHKDWFSIKRKKCQVSLDYLGENIELF